MGAVYSEILRASEAQGFAPPRHRVSLPKGKLLSLVLRAGPVFDDSARKAYVIGARAWRACRPPPAWRPRARRDACWKRPARPAAVAAPISMPRSDGVIDNGNHLVLSGNRAVHDYLARIGARDALAGPRAGGIRFCRSAQRRALDAAAQ